MKTLVSSLFARRSRDRIRTITSGAQSSTRSTSACIGPTQEKTSVLGLSAGPLGPRYGQPVLIPHAPSSESDRRYTEAPKGDKTRPIRRVPVAAAVARSDGPPWFSLAQVGHGWRTDLRKLLSGARSSGKGSVRSPVVGWSNGIGIARPEESESWFGSMNGAATFAASE
jgi:hypothetical protein